MPITIKLKIERTPRLPARYGDSVGAKLVEASGTQTIIDISGATVESRGQAADVLQTIVDSLREGDIGENEA